MTDQLDQAQELEELARSRALEAAQNRHTETQLRVSGSVRCLDCDAEVGQERLAAHPTAARCIYCQTAWEKQHGKR